MTSIAAANDTLDVEVPATVEKVLVMPSDPVLVHNYRMMDTYVQQNCLQADGLRFSALITRAAKSLRRKAARPVKVARATRVKKAAPAALDPRMPDRTVTPYIHFCKDQRPLLDSTQKQTDTMKILGRMWKELGPDGQKPYHGAPIDAPGPAR
jgi:hypothetical protein